MSFSEFAEPIESPRSNSTTFLRKMKEIVEAQVGVSWLEALIIASIVVVNVRHCAANGLWILRPFRAAAFFDRRQVYERVSNDRVVWNSGRVLKVFGIYALPTSGDTATRRIYGGFSAPIEFWGCLHRDAKITPSNLSTYTSRGIRLKISRRR